VINAGGLINVYVELHGYDRTRALALTREIYSRLRKVFAVAHDLGIPTSAAADRIVEQRLAQGRRERTSRGTSAADVSGNPATSVTGAMTPSH
jgi:glutamate dehydrogenase/leucine dehydrogenase